MPTMLKPQRGNHDVVHVGVTCLLLFLNLVI